MPKRLYMVLLSWCCVVLLYHRPLQAVPFPILDIVNPDKFDHPLTWSPHHLGSARLPEGTLAGWYDSNDIQANDIVFLPWHWGFKNHLTPGTSLRVLANGSAGSSSASIHTNFVGGHDFVPGMLMKFDQDPTNTIYRVTAATPTNTFSISPPLASSLSQSNLYVGYVLKMPDKSGFHRTVGAYPFSVFFSAECLYGSTLA